MPNRNQSEIKPWLSEKVRAERLYKYLERIEYAEAMLEGMIKVGTLSEYRSYERHESEADGIADRREGTWGREIGFARDEDLLWLNEHSQFRLPPGAAVENFLAHNSTDQVVYCTSTMLHPNVRDANRGSKFVVEISDPAKFGELLAAAQHKVFGKQGVCERQVNYWKLAPTGTSARPELARPWTPQESVWVKGEQFAMQFEYRHVFNIPIERLPADRLLSIQGLSSIVRLVDPEELNVAVTAGPPKVVVRDPRDRDPGASSCWPRYDILGNDRMGSQE